MSIPALMDKDVQEIDEQYRAVEGFASKEYSDIMRSALTSPAYMKQKLTENRRKITDAAYKKATAAADSLEDLFCVSEMMLRVISYVFERLEEVTPLMLQKLLYFIQEFTPLCMEGRSFLIPI